jgi:transposase
MEGRQRRSFTDDYKRQAVDLVASSGRSIGSVAKELGLRDSVLRRWVEQRGARREPTAAARRSTQAALPSADHAAEIARLQRENERLRMERDIFKKSIAIFAGVQKWDSASSKIAAPTIRWGSCATCSASRRLAYAWRARPESPRAAANRELVDDIKRVHRDANGRYGSPRVYAELRAQGRRASRGRFERSMRHHGIRAIMARPRRMRTTDSRHDFPIAPNLLERNFIAAAPNRIWLADIT